MPFVSQLVLSDWKPSDHTAGPYLGRVRTPAVGDIQVADKLTYRVLFMSATDEELNFVSSKAVQMDHETYILLMFRFVSAVISHAVC